MTIGLRGMGTGIRSRAARVLWQRGVLAVLLLAQGIGKLLDPPAYIRALRAFDVVPHWLAWPLGGAWLFAELGFGALLLVALSRARMAVPAHAGAVLLSTAYLLLTGHAYARGLDVRNCTCFGGFLAQRLSVFVVAQDAYVLIWTVWLLRGAVIASSGMPPRVAGGGTLASTDRAGPAGG